MATINNIGSGLPIEISFGGTEQVTLTNNAPLKGNGTNPILDFGQGLDGQILIGSATGIPQWQNITAGTAININNAANEIDITTAPGGSVFTNPTPFMPVLNFSVSSAGITYTTQSGYYLTAGPLTLFTIHILLSSKGTASGNAFISGIPGTIIGTDEFPCVCVMYSTAGFTQVQQALQGAIQVSSNTINITINNLTTNNPSLTDANFTNTTEIYMNGIYFTS